MHYDSGVNSVTTESVMKTCGGDCVEENVQVGFFAKLHILSLTVADFMTGDELIDSLSTCRIGVRWASDGCQMGVTSTERYTGSSSNPTTPSTDMISGSSVR